MAALVYGFTSIRRYMSHRRADLQYYCAPKTSAVCH